MHHNVIAAALQVVGILTVTVAAFTVSTALGAACVGAGAWLVGVALEDDA